jgi:hypothetical protein
VLNTEIVISRTVTANEREIVFKKIAITISIAPRMACSFQASGRMSSGTNIAAAAKANSPNTTDPKRAERLELEADSIMRATSTQGSRNEARTRQPQVTEKVTL